MTTEHHFLKLTPLFIDCCRVGEMRLRLAREQERLLATEQSRRVLELDAAVRSLGVHKTS